ncbi:hypothetical protein [Vulcanisaeta sp. JCM 16161]|uniref:hypothetical protein n=1 Tax=Vulcanisaeta sp. JCM 16161 TaxID=1295372 RepID=UPI0006D19E1A|nr:hypothetical protein [Vulcanisaeta sp. JCM 16161]
MELAINIPIIVNLAGGKGGVGTSTVTANMAYASARRAVPTGLLASSTSPMEPIVHYQNSSAYHHCVLTASGITLLLSTTRTRTRALTSRQA